MQTNHNQSVSGQELDNLLKQAFLNLDVTHPKNDALMETVANHTLNKPVPLAGTASSSSSFFSFLKWILAVVSILSVLVFSALFNKEQEEPDVIKTLVVSTPDLRAETNEVPFENPATAVDAKAEITGVIKKEDQQEISHNNPVTQSTPVQPMEKPSVAFVATEEKTPADTGYVFPVLTAEEIKANQKQKKKMTDQLGRFHKDKYAYIPMGSFIFGKDTFSCQAFYMQTTEVSNLEYRTFLFDLLIAGRKQEFLKAKPDQQQWIERFNDEANLEPMKMTYFSHPAYNDYPVVNVSRKGAEMYCIWLTLAANEKLRDKQKPLINDLRLPMDYEWGYAASNGKYKIRYANGWENLRDRRGLYIQNYNCAGYAQCRHDTVHDLYLYESAKDREVKPADDGGFLTTAVRSYAPNAYGLYDMAGNVSEMVYMNQIRTRQASGFGTKGGSWFSPDYFLEIDAAQEFKYPDKPSPFVGFRPVITAPIANKAGQ